ncbi:DNA polymerase I [invertebrate metagenome]|uniref:DNA-directed DNA polymerase n=1 Tax=invertebrate metagenome TaxID=1711999 RepID=A0A2H9T6V2_9ZZZZ
MSSEQPSAPLVLVDGSSYLYRAYHASERANLQTSSGHPTGAINVIARMLNSLVREYDQSCVVIVFDAKGKNFRHELYSDYKATRKPMPDDLRCQVEPIHAIVQAMGLPLFMVEGVEADDVLGTLAQQATERQIATVISTGDKDIAQLVNSYVSLIDTMKNTHMGPAEVEQKFGVAAGQIIDFLALMGDSSDNIPGMPGVGEKTAVALLQGLGSLKNIEQHLDKVADLTFRGSKAFAKKFAEHRDMVLLSKELATIKTDVKLPMDVDKITRHPVDKEALIAIYQQYELHALIKDLEKNDLVRTEENSESSTEKKPDAVYETVTTQERLTYWLKKLKNAELFAFDTETTSVDYMVAELVGLSFSVEPGEAAYVPVGHDYVGVPEQLDRGAVLQALKPILENASLKKVGQNLKYDKGVLARYDIDLQGIVFDTMLESYVLKSVGTRHDMDSLAQAYLGHTTIHYEDVAGKGVKQLTFNQVELEKAAPYAAEDADITLQLHQTLWPQLKKEPLLCNVFEAIEMPLLPVISTIERNGALVDVKQLGVQSRELTERLTELQEKVWEMAGVQFNLSSPKQLQEILYDQMQIPVIKKTPKGQPSTAEEVLQKLALDYPLPKLLMEYRSLNKLKTTYTDKLPKMVNPFTGRIHTSYHQAVTATGRLSSSDPNLQNIPIRTEEGRRIRQAFIAPEGYQLVAADYSQIELRIMAHLSKDKGLLDAFAGGQDIHRATAAEVFGVALENVTTQERRSAKAINFGLIYGMSAFGLSKQLGISRASAQEYIDVYFERYPGVLHYMDSIRSFAHEHGYVETLFGRRLYLPEIHSRNGNRRQGAERTAINAPMQGTAADIIKRAMVSVDNWLREKQFDARITLQVHDELVMEVAEKDVPAVSSGIEAVMSSAADLTVPLLVGVGVGDNWDQAH